VHYRKALETLVLHDFTCHVEPPEYVYPARVLISLRASVPYNPSGNEVIAALHIAMRNRTQVEPITAADLGLAERLAVARDTIATATPEQLAELAVCVDAAISSRGVAEYRSPADVARIAELEGL
jgi:hypothetical protein